MQLLSLLTILVLLETAYSTCPAPETDTPHECNELDYMKYVQCVRKRIRRSVDCETNCDDEQKEETDCADTCNECNCDYCSSNSCQTFCSKCCHATTCSTNSCCHRTCSAQCRSSRCRHSCKKDCTSQVPSLNGGNVTSGTSSTINNITTIITLHTAINNTNINHLSLDNSVLSSTPLEKIVINNNSTSDNKCCQVVGPQQCNQTNNWPFVSCGHQSAQKCGQVCRSPVMHMVPFKSCTTAPPQQPQCNRSALYIPQPQPRCFHQHAWPYVSCGIQQARPHCGGCYQHYVNPFTPSFACHPACYDEGYGVGPYYRQGPFYRRGYGHAPSCYQIGGCYDEGYGQDYGYGLRPEYTPFQFGGGGGYPPTGNFPFAEFEPEVLYPNSQDNGTDIENFDQIQPYEYYSYVDNPQVPQENPQNPPQQVTVKAFVNRTARAKPKQTNKAVIEIQSTKSILQQTTEKPSKKNTTRSSLLW